MTDTPALECLGLTVRRDGKTLLDRVTMQVAPGSIHVVIGPNGAGKSTLLAALLGQIEFSGIARCHFRKNGALSFVPQSLDVDATLPVTALELLALTRQSMPICLGIRAVTRARVASLLERVGLSGFESRRLGALSGGELRRVLVANALDPEPEILMLDEPSTGLDQASGKRLEKILEELRGAGASILLVSHDIQQVRRIADTVTWIDRSVQATGTPSQVLGGSPFFPFSGAG